jgi:hypothetical protein
LCAAAVVALSLGAAAPAVAQNSKAPRTGWGKPDLNGIWDFRTITPLERPANLADREFLTEAEAAKLEQDTIERNAEIDSRRPSERPQAETSTGARMGHPGSTTTSGWTAERSRSPAGARRWSSIRRTAECRH